MTAAGARRGCGMIDRMQIRPTALDDAAAITEIIAAVAEEGVLGTEPPVDVAERAERLRTMLAGDPAPVAFVLIDDRGAVLGSATASSAGPPGVLGLGMAIAREARGRGGGRRLLDAVIAEGRHRGAHKLDLEVWPDNGRAIALYVAAGFTVQGVKHAHYRRRDGSLRSAVMMTRRLDGG